MGVRELKGSLSKYLRRVRQGESILVTDRGEPVARLIPVGYPEGLVRLAREGRATLPRRWPPEIRLPSVRLKGGKSAAELVIEDRESDERDLADAVLGRRRRGQRS